MELRKRLKSFLTFVIIAVDDFLRLAVVWVLLFLFRLFPKYMPVPGFAGRVIEEIHQVGSVAIGGLLVWFLIIDVIESRKDDQVNAS